MANTENMAKWAEALESGKYEQGTNHLAQVGTGIDTGKTFYCCLGVACEVAILNGVELLKEQTFSLGIPVWAYDGESGVLPPKVREWLGFDTDSDGNLDFADGSATGLNDESGYTFGELAEQVRVTYLTPA